jgi:glycine/sarcosine N-methyltransferase
MTRSSRTTPLHRSRPSTQIGKWRIVFQVWEWHDDRRYTFHSYITRETSAGWTNFHGTSAYRAVLRDEVTAILESSGLTNIRWQFQTESRFYQPVVIAATRG